MRPEVRAAGNGNAVIDARLPDGEAIDAFRGDGDVAGDVGRADLSSHHLQRSTYHGQASIRRALSEVAV